MENARIFLTDYASYNNGTQFEFGHWVNLSNFNDDHELHEYIVNHFREADEKSPLPGGTPREEVMVTDFEGFPEELYSESMSSADFERLYRFFDLLKLHGLDSFDNKEDNLLSLWNEYCRENNPDDEIFYFDEDTLSMILGDDPMKAFMAGVYAEINWSDNYLYFDGYGNIHSTNDPSRHIDEAALLEWMLENC